MTNEEYCCEDARERAEIRERIEADWSDVRLMAWASGKGALRGAREGFLAFVNTRIAWALIALALAMHAVRLLIEVLR